MTWKAALPLLGALAIALGPALPAPASQEPDPAEAPAAAPDSASSPDPRTPRGAVLAYLEAARKGDLEQAARHLDLSPVAPSKRAERGPVLAGHLKIVLDRTLWVDVDALSSEPEGARDDGLPARRDRVGVIQTASGPVDVFVDRVPESGQLVWKISPTTVARIPALYDEFGDGRLGELLPAIFFERQLLELRLWQWVGLTLLVLVAFAASWLIVRALLGALRPAVARSATQVDDRLVEALGGPLRMGAALALFAIGLRPLGLALPAERFFERLELVLAVWIVTWLVLRVIDIFASLLASRLEEQGQQPATALVPLGRKTVKVVVVGLALLAALDSFGFDVTALIAGLGVGGLAVALAAQKTIENLFGGATLIADRPVRVGDFCRFGDKVGVVEAIGLRSTRIRTLARTLVTVPNAEFSALQLENFAARDKIWFNPRLGLRYETTPDQLRYVLVEIRRMLYSHPRVDRDPARVRFVSFGDFSLDLDIYAYILATDFSDYLEVAEDLNLRIMDIVEKSGTGFAFPSSTTYLAKDDGLDAERSREAEQQVERWRSQRELYLPGFPPEKVAELAGSLPYPPEGAPEAR